MEIIPAIMPSSYEDIKEKAQKIVGLVSYAQIDVMDGEFVPSRSWPYRNDGVVERIDLPFQDKLRYEVDLMVSDPLRVLSLWIDAGVSRIIFHIESVADPRAFVHNVRGSYDKISLGVAVGIETRNEILEDIMDDIDVVQFMGIARIGYQRQPFDERVLDKIHALRQTHPETIISVDGGVNFDTASRLIEAGATRLVAGSAIFMAENIAEAIKKFQQL